MLRQVEGTPERQHGSAHWHGRVALRTIECLSATEHAVDAIHRILRVIVDETGIRYAGIRLKNGDDFPFYVFNGFSREFIRLENSLCLRNPDGTLAVDAQGRPALACVCGRILRGQMLPSEDFFTSGGSFFTPCLQTLATTVDPAKLGPIRGRCIAEGFQTHALIPLRRDGETIGLLHLSDPSPHMLAGDDIAFLERLGASVGVALTYKQATELQRLTNDIYRELFEELGWGYARHEMIFDEKGAAADYVTLDINQSFAKLLGAPRETVVGTRASAILPEAELASWLAIFSPVAAGGPPTTYEIYSPHNQKHFCGHAYSLKRGFFAVTFEDVTERNQARARLAESEARYRTLVETAEDAILLTDLDGKHIFKNSAYYTSLGYAPGEPISPDGYDRVHPDDLDRLKQLAPSVIARGSAASEYRVRHKDGHWIWRSGRSTLIRDEFGQPNSILAVLRDISLRKGMEEDLRENRARLGLALRSAQMGVWHWDIESDRRCFDDQVCALLGIDPMTFTGLAEEFFQVVHPDDRARIGAALARTISHNVPYEVEYRVLWRDGSVHHITARGALACNEAGKPQRINGVIWDVSERKRAEEERQKLQSQLLQAQKMEALGTLAGGIAHDFNNVLAAILGGVELASMKTDALPGAQGEAIRRELGDVQHAAQRASALVKQILSFSRRNPEDKKPLFLRPLVKEACKFLRSALPTTIEIHQALSIDGPVLANPTQIHQIVMNLLTNAGLAMPEGGRIDVGLDQMDLDEDFVVTHPGLAPGRFVRLSVRDTGCGITAENLGRIFEPLFTTRSERHGTGLGLAIVHGIVAEHGGAVTVASEVGKGATFEVFLPLHEQAIPAAVLRERRLPGTERVLFVDDEETLVQMAERGLGCLGYQVKGFVSSVEALRAFRAAPHAFDIVVTDLTMPGLTGDVLAREIRRLRPDLPVVILTGAQPMAHERNPAAGFDAFLLKPVTVAGLTVCLRRIFDSKE